MIGEASFTHVIFHIINKLLFGSKPDNSMQIKENKQCAIDMHAMQSQATTCANINMNSLNMYEIQ